jgi:hypothetical protein
MLEIWGNTEEIAERLKEILDRMDDLSSLLKEIGEGETESTKHRFDTLTDPAGFEWQKNSPLVIARKGNDRPLTGKTHMLKDTRHLSY